MDDKEKQELLTLDAVAAVVITAEALERRRKEAEAQLEPLLLVVLKQIAEASSAGKSQISHHVVDADMRAALARELERRGFRTDTPHISTLVVSWNRTPAARAQHG